MSDKQTPDSQEPEVLEGEVIQKDESPKKSESEKSAKSTSTKKVVKESKLKKMLQPILQRAKESILHFGFALLVVLALIFLYSQQSWLQNRFDTVATDLQTLDQKIAQSRESAGSASSSVQDLQQQLDALSDKVSQVQSGASAEDLQQLKQSLQAEIEQKATTASAPQESNENLQALESKILELQNNQSQLLAKSKDPMQITSPGALSLQELKQWALKINGQWLLQAPVEQVVQQLEAFKLALSSQPKEIAYSIQLLLDQDLQNLESHRKAMENRQIPSIEPVRQLILNMPKPKVNFEGAHEAQSENAESTIWQGLLDKLSALVKVQKREQEGVSHVESLMLHEVIQQRLLFEADRVEYAVQISSTPLLERSITSLLQIVSAQAPQIEAEMKKALLPFQGVPDLQRKSLLVSKIATEAQS